MYDKGMEETKDSVEQRRLLVRLRLDSLFEIFPLLSTYKSLETSRMMVAENLLKTLTEADAEQLLTEEDYRDWVRIKTNGKGRAERTRFERERGERQDTITVFSSIFHFAKPWGIRVNMEKVGPLLS